MTPDNGWLTCPQNGTHITFEGTPNSNTYAVQYTLEVVTTDPYTDVDDHVWNEVFVIIVNDPPVIGAMADQTLLAPDPHSWIFGASLASDPEGLSYTRSLRFNGSDTIPNWLNYDLSDYSFWMITSSNSYAGIHLVTVVITDEFNTEVTKSFNLEVQANSAPQKQMTISSYSIVNFNLLTIEFEDIHLLFGDPDGRPMTASLRQGNGDPLPSFLAYNSITNTLSGVPSYIHIGDWPISFVAVDDHGLEGNITFKVAVKRKRNRLTNIA